jgi:hypothetical protein
MASEDAAEEAAPEELMPSVCWSQLEKLLPRMALPEALQLESASEAAAAPVRRRTASDLHRKNLLQKTYRRGPAECQSREKVCGCSAAGRTLPGSKTQRTADGFDLIVTILAGFVKRKLSG